MEWGCDFSIITPAQILTGGIFENSNSNSNQCIRTKSNVRIYRSAPLSRRLLPTRRSKMLSVPTFWISYPNALNYTRTIDLVFLNFYPIHGLRYSFSLSLLSNTPSIHIRSQRALLTLYNITAGTTPLEQIYWLTTTTNCIIHPLSPTSGAWSMAYNMQRES